MSDADYALEAAKGRNEKLKSNSKYLERLRIEARRNYLSKREEERLQLAERLLAEKEFVYSAYAGKRGKEVIELEKRTIELAKEAAEARNRLESQLEYHLPDSYDDNVSAKLALINKRAIDRSSKTTQDNEFLSWESSKIANVKKSLRTPSGKKALFDLVPNEDGIEFIKSEIHGEMKFDTNAPAASTIEIKKTFDEEDYDTDDSDAPETFAEKVLWKKTKQERLQHQKLTEERTKLPVFSYRQELLEAVRKYPIVIVVGETGSGKTTQIPQYLYEVGYGKAGRIACTQPRRVAAMAVASRVAKEQNVKLGTRVGYTIRFEDCTSKETVIKYMTDGMLLREMMSEPDLSSYSCLMIDEAHERTIHTDIIFGLAKDLSRYRQNFRLIVSSATLEAEKFAAYFDGAPIFNVPGRRYPVQIYYTKAPEANYLTASVVTALQIHLTQPLGDILIFLPGQLEIEQVQEELEARIRGFQKEIKELIVLPIYATLPSELQAKIFEPTPPNARKVILATNIAETSITLDNIVYVVDPGFCKQNSYSPKTGRMGIRKFEILCRVSNLSIHLHAIFELTICYYQSFHILPRSITMIVISSASKFSFNFYLVLSIDFIIHF